MDLENGSEKTLSNAFEAKSATAARFHVAYGMVFLEIRRVKSSAKKRKMALATGTSALIVAVRTLMEKLVKDVFSGRP